MLRKYTTINWNTALLSLMPPVLRKQKHALWLHVLLKPLTSIYEDTLYKMQHNGQVIYLEKVLNEIFNKTRTYKPYNTTGKKLAEGLIFIDDATRPEVQFLFTHDEIQNGNLPITTYTQHDPVESRNVNNFLFLSGDVDFRSTEYFNFRINIPDDLLITQEDYNFRVVDIMNNDELIEDEKKKQIADLDCMLIINGEHPFTSHPDAVRVNTPLFHRVLSFYKLAGKSYETRGYETPDVENQLE